MICFKQSVEKKELFWFLGRLLCLSGSLTALPVFIPSLIFHFIVICCVVCLFAIAAFMYIRQTTSGYHVILAGSTLPLKGVIASRSTY